MWMSKNQKLNTTGEKTMAEVGQGWYKLPELPLIFPLYSTFFVTELQLPCVFLNLRTKHVFLGVEPFKVLLQA